jgi:hypothetical protein
MTIESGVAILSILGVIATTFLSLFVGQRISSSERRMLREMADTYLPREVADEKFRYYDYRIGATPTPTHPRRALADDGVT